MKKHTITEWCEMSPRAYVTNGFVGLKIGKNPYSNNMALLSGFYGVHRRDVESLCLVPTVKVRFLYEGNEVFPETKSQTYDFSCGELQTESVIKVNDITINVTHNIFCSRTSPTIVGAEMKIVSSEPVKLSIETSLELWPDRAKSVRVENWYYKKPDYDGGWRLYSADNKSTAGVAYRVLGDVTNRMFWENRNMVDVYVGEGASTVQILTSYIPGIMHAEPHNQAMRMIKLATWNGLDRIREMNHKAWDKIWESRIEVEGAGEEWQNVIDASYFYLMSSASEFAPVSIPPYGLSDADAYEGHCFWDTESFMFMTPLFCAPNVARSMLDYRFERIDAAKYNARINGYLGIQFPWQSGSSGCEVTVPDSGQAGGAGEQHVNLDIALAFDAFARMSGDIEFIREKAWPIMRGVSEWIETRCDKTERGYEILHVTGIDEGSDDVPNDSYTNLMSAKILRAASEYSEKLGYGKRQHWLDIADKMFIPSREDGVLPQYEGMPEQQNQPSTVLMSYFPYGYKTDNDVPTFEYYITHGMDIYITYPMLSGFLGIFPAWIGDRKLALEYYERANFDFVCQPFYACTEDSFPDPEERLHPKEWKATCFLTARGSLLSGLLMGLTKICPWNGSLDADINEWLGEDIILPEGWNKVILNKVYIRGKAYKITAEHGAKHAILEEINE